jgi:hypothetical protein
MHHITHSSLAVFRAICLLYALLVLAILKFWKVAKLKPNPPNSSTVRVELTISAQARAGADPGESEGTCITTTFVFADELARTVTDFLAGYNSPSRSDLSCFLQLVPCSGARVGYCKRHMANFFRHDCLSAKADIVKVKCRITQAIAKRAMEHWISLKDRGTRTSPGHRELAR